MLYIFQFLVTLCCYNPLIVRIRCHIMAFVFLLCLVVGWWLVVIVRGRRSSKKEEEEEQETGPRTSNISRNKRRRYWFQVIAWLIPASSAGRWSTNLRSQEISVKIVMKPVLIHERTFFFEKFLHFLLLQERNPVYLHKQGANPLYHQHSRGRYCRNKHCCILHDLAEAKAE